MGGISFDAPFPLLYESAKKLTSTSRSYQLLIDAPAESLLSCSNLVRLSDKFCLPTTTLTRERPKGVSESTITNRIISFERIVCF